MAKKGKYYSLYKGDREIAFGTMDEIAKKLNLNKRTIEFFKTPTYQKRCGNYVLVYVPELTKEEVNYEYTQKR